MEYNTFQNRIPLLAIHDNPKWDLFRFNELLVDDTKNALKIKKDDYLDSGKYPIVDQGQSVIAGYTDDKNGIYQGEEVIIFGDHTRILKYVDFPLFLGADGVKLLKAKLDKFRIDMKYIYYFLKTVELPNDGYSRHFKYLKEVIIPVPSIEIQRKIVYTFDRISKIIDKRKEQIASCDEVIKSQFIEMFGDLIHNTKGWETVTLEKCADILTGNPFKSQGYTDDNNQIKICGGLIITPNGIEWEKANYWNRAEMEGLEKYYLNKDDIVLAMDRPWISNGLKIAMIKECDLPTVLIQRTARIRAKGINQVFMYYTLKDNKFKYHCKLTETTVPHIAMGDINNYEIPKPPVELQNQFASFVQQVNKLKFRMEQSLKELEANFDSLMQRAFKGELF